MGIRDDIALVSSEWNRIASPNESRDAFCRVIAAAREAETLRQERDDAVKDKAEIERQRDAVRKCLDDSERDLKDARERCDIAEETIVAVAECGISRAREAESRAAEMGARIEKMGWALRKAQYGSRPVFAPESGPPDEGSRRCIACLARRDVGCRPTCWMQVALSPQQAGKEETHG